MQTILIVMGILVVALIALILLFVFVKMVEFFNDQNMLMYGEDDDPSSIDEPSFRSGLNQGLFIAQMGLYKNWVETGESMLVGTFDNMRIDMDQNILHFFSDSKNMKEWNEKYLKYIEEKNKGEEKK